MEHGLFSTFIAYKLLIKFIFVTLLKWYYTSAFCSSVLQKQLMKLLKKNYINYKSDLSFYFVDLNICRAALYKFSDLHLWKDFKDFVLPYSILLNDELLSVDENFILSKVCPLFVAQSKRKLY